MYAVTDKQQQRGSGPTPKNTAGRDRRPADSLDILQRHAGNAYLANAQSGLSSGEWRIQREVAVKPEEEEDQGPLQRASVEPSDMEDWKEDEDQGPLQRASVEPSDMDERKEDEDQGPLQRASVEPSDMEDWKEDEDQGPLQRASVEPSDMEDRQEDEEKRSVFQAKRVVGPSDDNYEQEADRVADSVVNGSHKIQAVTQPTPSPVVQRQEKPPEQPTTLPVEEPPKQGQEKKDAENEKIKEIAKKITSEFATMVWDSRSTFSPSSTAMRILDNIETINSFLKKVTESTGVQVVLGALTGGSATLAFFIARNARDDVVLPNPLSSNVPLEDAPRTLVPTDEKFIKVEFECDFSSLPSALTLSVLGIDLPKIIFRSESNANTGTSGAEIARQRQLDTMFNFHNYTPGSAAYLEQKAYDSAKRRKQTEAMLPGSVIGQFPIPSRSDRPHWWESTLPQNPSSPKSWSPPNQTNEPRLHYYISPLRNPGIDDLLTGRLAKKPDEEQIQRKLSIGTSNDPLEQEADRVAGQVLAAPANPAVRGIAPSIQRYTGKSAEGSAPAPASVDRVLSSTGRPLEPAVRQYMEPRFGHDFSHVRVHTGDTAEQSAREVNAHAYTAGHNIVFGTGRYEPETHEGRRLLAHELTHVVQQRGRAG